MTNDNLSHDESEPGRLLIDGNTAMNECIERMFLACRSTIQVRARRLDYDFYFSQAFTECCQSIVARSRRNELMFLVEDEKFVIKANVRLVALARQFSSYIKVRVIPETLVKHQEMFIVSDDSGYLHQPGIDIPRGVMNPSDPGNAHRLGRQFKDLWDRSEQPAELFATGL